MGNHHNAKSQRGVVLLLALIALLLISAVGAAILFMAMSESSIVGSQKVSARAFYSGMAGLEEARYRMIPILPDLGGGLNNTDAINPADNTAAFAMLPAIPPPGTPPLDVLYVINTNNPASPANFNVFAQAPGAVANQPAAINNDPLRPAEVPNLANIRAVATMQPGGGGNASVPWRWVRMNVKTEVAANQDLNLDNFQDEAPVFLYQTRQYRAPDLMVMDPNVLPPPWGPDPTLQVPPILDRPCVSVLCASPIYVITSLSTIPGVQSASRIVRVEVAVVPAFALNATVLSEPGINVSGNMDASGRDICDPDCAFLADGTGPFNLFAGQNQFQNRPETDVPANCDYAIPLQSQTPGSPPNDPGPNSATADPSCDPANPDCDCSGGAAKSCIQSGVPPQYDVDQLINALRPLARELATPVGTYYPQVGSSNLTCDATGCQGQKLELGGFPFTDPVAQTGPDPINGVNADPIITYVNGDFKCTSSCTGAGILIVDGDLELNASMAFYGTIIVRGDVSVLGGGNPPTDCNIYGGLVSSGGVETKIGGSICFQYNSCSQRNLFTSTPLVTLSFREIPD